MMRKIGLLLVLLACRVLLAAPVASWNFEKGVNSDDGRIEMRTYGKTSVAEDHSLVMTGGTNAAPVGIRALKLQPELNPMGDWAVTVRFQLDKEALAANPDKKMMVLVDHKFHFWPPAGKTDAQFHSGFALLLIRRGANFWAPATYIGYGDKSGMASGITRDFADGKPHTLACRFSTKGEIAFEIDGKPSSTHKVPAGAMAPACFPFAIGDRAGASYWGVEGRINSVVLDFVEQEPMTIQNVGRAVFERTEEAPEISFMLFNNTPNALSKVVATAQLDGKSIQLPPMDIEAWGKSEARVSLPKMLRPGEYAVKLNVACGQIAASAEASIAVVAEMNPEAMPVFMWQSGDAAKIAEIGFTHQMEALALRFQNKSKGDLADAYQVLDTNLRNGLRTCDVLLSVRDNEYLQRFNRVDRKGVPFKRKNFDASNPELQKLVYADAERAAAAYGAHPGLDMVLVNSEVRDGSAPAFNGTEEAAYKKMFGRAVPAEVNGRTPPPLRSIAGVSPLDNIPEDLPLLQYYRWWWKDGDGWNEFHRACFSGYRKGLGDKADSVIGFYDPAVRVPPIFGSGAGLNMLNQWSYSYHSPLKLATATDELRAMARGNGGQKLMKTTQAIWYRSPPAPPDKVVQNPPAWVKEYPNAPYITIAPDHLQEAFWSKISRRLDVIAYHGYGSLVEADTRPWNQYRFTNSESRVVLKKIIGDVVRPLGPVLKKVPECDAECAVLYTQGSNIFGRTGSWGWGWGADAEMHQLLQRAQLDPAIVFDEDIVAGRLANVRILALPNCAILTDGIIKAIHDFQLKGGIVIGDRDLNALVLPDVTVDLASKEPEKEIARLLKALDGVYAPFFAADSTDVSMHLRRWKKSDYVFVVNDRRTFGDYVGMYGNVKEKGLPLSCNVSFAQKDVAAVYDPVKHVEVPFTKKDGKCSLYIDFTTNDGRLFIVLPQKIGGMTVKAPAKGRIGGEIVLQISLFDDAKKPVEAILPIELDIRSSDGRQIVGSGFYEVTDGAKSIRIRPSSNDAAGKWRVSVKELASGKAAETTFAMEK